jgi:hypothetical protein
MSISKAESAPQPDLSHQPADVTEAAQDNLRSALELAKKMLSEEAIVETLHQGLDTTHIVIAGSNEDSVGRRTGRTGAETIIISLMGPVEFRRARLIEKRRAERKAQVDAQQNDS